MMMRKEMSTRQGSERGGGREGGETSAKPRNEKRHFVEPYLSPPYSATNPNEAFGLCLLNQT